MSLPTRITVKKTKAVYEVVQKKKVIKIVEPEIKKIVQSASTIKEINHQVVQYKGSKYIVGYCAYKEQDILFVTDYQNSEFYKNLVLKAWHLKTDGEYIGHTYYLDDGSKRELYLHNFVCNKLTHDGKGQHHSIDHINRIGRDNRKVNLRELTQSHQNINQSKRERVVELPDGCGIDPNDIPKNIYYKPPSGAHGDLFYIEIRTPEIVKILCPQEDTNKFRWFGTKSKTLDLRVKLQHTINKLQEIKTAHPQIADLIGELDNTAERNELAQSFNDILGLTTYPTEIIESNKAPLIVSHNPIPISEVQTQLAQEIEEKTIRGLKSHLPEGCGITPQMIPKYCYYKPASETRGDKFVIERHPGLISDGKRQWATTESKKFTTKQKFNLMMERLNELDQLTN